MAVLLHSGRGKPSFGGEGALTTEDLVEEDLDVVGCERLRRHDHLVQVALHQLRDHVSGRSGVKAKTPRLSLRGLLKEGSKGKDTSPRSSRSEEAAGCPEPRGPAEKTGA